VQWLFQQAQASGFEDVTHSFAQSIDKGHGRIEIRRCWTLSELDYREHVILFERISKANKSVSTGARVLRV